MVAVVQITESNGTTGAEVATQKDGSTVRFKNAADKEVDIVDPMVIPTAGQDWSFQKWLRLNVTTAPDTNLTNLKFYTDGTGWSAADAFVKAWAVAEATYASPIAASGSSQFSTDMFALVAATSLDLGTAAVTSTGLVGSYAHLALEVEAGATQGTLVAETLTFAFDEL